MKTLSFIYKDLRLEMNMGGMEMQVDSDERGPEIEIEDIETNPKGLVNRIFDGIKSKKFIRKVNKE